MKMKIRHYEDYFDCRSSKRFAKRTWHKKERQFGKSEIAFSVRSFEDAPETVWEKRQRLINESKELADQCNAILWDARIRVMEMIRESGLDKTVCYDGYDKHVYTRLWEI